MSYFCKRCAVRNHLKKQLITYLLEKSLFLQNLSDRNSDPKISKNIICKRFEVRNTKHFANTPNLHKNISYSVCFKLNDFKDPWDV